MVKDVVQHVASPTALQHREPELPKRQLWTKDKENRHSQQQRSRSSSDSDGSDDGNPAALPSQNAEEGSSNAPCASTGRRKKKKTGAARKKAKAAAKRGSTPKLTAVKAPPAPPAIPAKQFRFGPVQIAYYERDIGSCCVPSDGSWALGLGERVPYSDSKEFATVPLEDHDAQRAERLAERAASLTKREKKACRGETRQWDFKLHNNRNPLFGRLSEKARRELLLGVADEAPRDPAHTLHTLHDEFVERSTELLHELDAIRRSRSTGGGCACAPLKVDKLPVTRLKEELRARHLPAEGNKKTLGKALGEALGAGGGGAHLCDSLNCDCARNGIQCQADLCGCCRAPKHGERDGCAGHSCSNAEGLYAYKEARVSHYRAPFVTAAAVEWDAA
eukprot:17182-Heterococcus_DN1.PRE.1